MKAFHVLDYGTFDPQANHQPMYDAAYADAVAYANPCEIVLAAKKWNVTGLRVKHRNIRLRGEGSGGYVFGQYHTQNDEGTILNYIGAPGGIALYIAPLSTATLPLYGSGVADVQIRGNNAAAVGMRLGSVTDSSFERIYSEDCTGAAMDTTASPTPNVTWCYFNEFRHIALVARGECKGLVLAGDWTQPNCGGRHTSMLSFTRLHVTHENKPAVSFHSCDNVTITGMASSRMENGTGDSLYFHGSSDGSCMRALGNTVLGLHGIGPIRALVGHTHGARGNVVVMNSTDNQPLVIQDAPGGVYVLDAGGPAPRNAYFKHPQLIAA